ncbi:hypothetical protein JG687_00012931 [Phytophthora cactorum]|uniref:Uncharacterized protein n=1 Tax=Phytophthora cactorum TaxID=29920 RepID=A0A8T1U2L4_9STRA|nr:hypothetical protein JG687_00012931 [Phytophthora cactorum]
MTGPAVERWAVNGIVLNDEVDMRQGQGVWRAPAMGFVLSATAVEGFGLESARNKNRQSLGTESVADRWVRYMQGEEQILRSWHARRSWH